MRELKENYSIDFVVTWVDGNDKKWQDEMKKYSTNGGSDSRSIRYRDWENLKYWFRGVEKFAPWVNNVYFITYGHLPEWLDVNNPKLKIVKHSDFIPDEYLPTFSSHPIELNLHRIKDLSEYFVYFNDDNFLINKVEPSDFFKNGKPCELAVFNPVTAVDETFVSILNNNNIVINRHFKKQDILKKNLKKYLNIKYGKYNVRTLLCLPWNRIVGFHNAHHCSPILKSTMEEVWEKEFNWLDETSKHKFRSKDDLNPYLFTYWQYCKGEFNPIKSKKVAVRIFDDVDKACKMINNNKIKMLCLNDSESTKEEFEVAKKRINDSLEMILSDKCSFEK